MSRGASTDTPDQRGDTCVHLAVRSQVRDILGLLVRKGANPDIINYEGQSALHLAVMDNDLDSVNILLRNGALVNIRSHHLVTPLMLAASSGDPQLVNTLIEFDARVEDLDKDGNTAIFYAKNKKKVRASVRRNKQSNHAPTSRLLTFSKNTTGAVNLSPISPLSCPPLPWFRQMPLQFTILQTLTSTPGMTQTCPVMRMWRTKSTTDL